MKKNLYNPVSSRSLRFLSPTASRLPPLSSRLLPGFTLVEMLVSVALFSVVMLIAVGALVTMAEANRKAETVKSVVNNLNFALDSMSRTIRTGYLYHCEDTLGVPSYANLAVPQDCPTNGSPYLAVEKSTGNPNASNDQAVFRVMNGRIERSYDSGNTYLAITAPEVVIDRMRFYVVGAAPGDSIQPKVMLTLAGHVQLTATMNTSLHLQTTITERLYDQ